MKKVLFIAGLFLLTISSYSQEQPASTAPVTETERIIDKYIDKTGEALQSLAETLKVPAEHVYGVLVKQQIVKGIGISAGAILFVVIAIIVTSILINAWQEEYRWDDIVMDQTALEFCAFIAWIFALILVIWFFVEGLACLINPEYGAIKDIMRVL